MGEEGDIGVLALDNASGYSEIASILYYLYLRLRDYYDTVFLFICDYHGKVQQSSRGTLTVTRSDVFVFHAIS